MDGSRDLLAAYQGQLLPDLVHSRVLVFTPSESDIFYYPQIVFHDMRTDCVGGAPISQWASRAPLAEIFPHGWGIHSFDSI